MPAQGYRKHAPRTRHFRAAVRLLAVVCLAAVSASAQQFFKTWTTENGLPQNNVINIAQTPDGYLWLATVDGLARFDGVRFKVFNKSNTPEMPTNRIGSMFADTAGRLWLNFPGDQTVVVYENGKFKAFVRGRDFEAEDYPRPVDTYGLYERGQYLNRRPEMRSRVGDREYVYEDGRFVERATRNDDFPSRVFAVDLDSIWINEGDALFHVEREKVTRYPKDGPLPFDRRQMFPVDSAEKDGVLWLFFIYAGQRVFADQPVRLLSFKDGKLTAFPLVSGLINLEFDKNGNLWISDYEKGIIRIDSRTVARHDPANFEIRRFGEKDGLLNGVTNFFTDRDGNLWLGGTKGLQLINPDPAVMVYSRATGLPADNVYPIVQDPEGTIWFSAWIDRLISYREDRFSSEFGLILTALFVDSRGRLWKGSAHGFYYRENGEWRSVNFKKGLPPAWSEVTLNNEVSFIAEDKDGAMWFGTSTGLIRYQKEGSRLFTVKDGLPSDVVTSYLLTRSGELWIGTNSGVARLGNGSFRAFTETDGLAGNFTRSFYEDADGTIWIGGYDGGLTRFKDGVFKKIAKRDGLFSDGVFVILEDAAGWFWMNSNQGIYRVRRQELNDFADGKLESVTSVSYGPEDGLLNVEGNGGKQPAGLEAADGRLWFPMAKGVAVIDPQAVRRETAPPPVLIEEARIDQKTIEITDGGIRLDPEQVALEVDYTALGFIGAERMRFRYRLEGLDGAWTDAGARRTAYFSHLPDGEYTFRVAAANYDGVWNNEGAAVRIVVVPPFYRKSWFYVLAVAVVFGIISFIYLYRLRRLQALTDANAEFARRLIESQESERRRIALELHDSLGQTLAVIRNRTLVGLDAGDAGKAFEQLREISEASSLALQETREIAHNLHPAQIENLGLTTALRSLVESIESATGMKCEADIAEVPEDLPYDAAINIYRIAQECLGNVIKHSGASYAAVLLRVDDGKLALTIEDDGRGFVENQIVKGLGLTGIRERARMIDAELTINSLPEHGTKTTLILLLEKQKT